MNYPYRPFYPLKRLKGKLNKVHKLKLNSYARYLYLNPIDGVLISYENTHKFPHSPNYVIKLDEIKDLKILMEHKWYFKKGQYYLRITSEAKVVIFYKNNLDLINFWFKEIQASKEFY